MQTKTIAPLIIFLLLCSNFSLAQFYYSPDAGNLSVLKEKNDLYLSSSFQSTQFSESSNSLQFEIGFSPIRNISIQSSLFSQKYISEYNGVKSFENDYHLWSTSLGYYYFFHKTSKKRRKRKRSKTTLKWFETRGLLADSHLGYGEGKSDLLFKNTENHQLSFQKFYCQFGVHWLGKFWGIDYSIRFGRINYYDIQSTFYGFNRQQIIDFQETLFSNSLLLNEVNLRFWLGIKQAKCFINYSGVHRSSHHWIKRIDTYNVELGIQINPFNFFKKKKGRKK